MMFKESLHINGNTFSLLNIRRNNTALYYNPDTDNYIRYGLSLPIMEEYKLHIKLYSENYLVSKIIDSKIELDKKYSYYIEKAIGEKSFGMIFESQFQSKGIVEKNIFNEYADVVLQHFQTQIKRSRKFSAKDLDVLRQAIYIDSLKSELPGYVKQIDEVWNIIKKEIPKLPVTWNHGDFNAFNLFRQGYVDLEFHFTGPLGYDAVSALITCPYWFPEIDLDNQKRKFDLSKSQITALYHLLQNKFESCFNRTLFKICFEINFILRSIWLTVKLDNWPKLQQWRYKHMISIISHFIDAKSLFSLLIE